MVCSGNIKIYLDKKIIEENFINLLDKWELIYYNYLYYNLFKSNI